MKRAILLFSIFYFGITTSMADARSPIYEPQSSVPPAYRSYKDIASAPISVPTVVDIPIVESFLERYEFALFDVTTNTFEPYFFRQSTALNMVPLSVSAIPYAASVQRMNDNDASTYADFPLPQTEQGRVAITLSSQAPITSSYLTALLDRNVALPTMVEISALVDGEDRIVVATKRMDQQTIQFPKTTSNRWNITFTFSQPLRISELRLNQDSAVSSSVRAIRFLAQPSHSYKLFLDPDRYAPAPVGESGNLASAQDVLVLPAVPSEKNPEYLIADVDSDGVPDMRDNCVSLPNMDQQDANNNGRGDACDDFDQDGLINTSDNCPNNPNYDQRDVDSDGIGDVCDKEESRITEQYPWIPWIGIGSAALVLVILFALTAKSTFVKERKGEGL